MFHVLGVVEAGAVESGAVASSDVESGAVESGAVGSGVVVLVELSFLVSGVLVLVPWTVMPVLCSLLCRSGGPI